MWLFESNFHNGFCFVGIGLKQTVDAAACVSGEKDGTNLKNLAVKMSTFLINSRNDNTSKAYYNSFRRWGHFIKSQGFLALSAQPIHVSLYITHLLDTGASYDTINSAIYSIKWVHQLHSFNDPTNNLFVTSLQEAGKRIACPKKCKKTQLHPICLYSFVKNLDIVLICLLFVTLP